MDQDEGVELPPAPFDGMGAAALVGRIEAQLDGVARALRRLDDGTYGSCEVCGTRLAPAELEEQPLQTRCPNHALG